MIDLINKRVKEVVENKEGGNVSAFANKINVRQNTLSQYFNNKRTLSLDVVLKTSQAYPDLNMNWLITGDGEMLVDSSSHISDVTMLYRPKFREAHTDAPIPLYNIDAAANLRTMLDNKDQNIIGRIIIPDMPICDGAIRVRGDSMYPILKSGDIVVYKEVSDTSSFIFGEMYLIDYTLNGEYYLVVKYVKKSTIDDNVKLVSYNPHHEPMDIPIAGIRAMALVKASIRLNTMI